MIEIYYVIVAFLLLLAVFDLFVGVSNDAVNFLNSAIGAKVARFQTVMTVASIGVLLGAMLSSGMMDIARHGILQPSYYSFEEVMTIFLAVMVTDVVILDLFNSLGMPTSTTVSLVFELMGATFVTACMKTAQDSSLSLGMLMNSDKALSVIIAIFASVAIAFVSGALVQWILRLTFTFNYRRRLRYLIGIFGGISFTSLAYFILIKGAGNSPLLPSDVNVWIQEHTGTLLLLFFLTSGILSQILHHLRVNVLRIIVLAGTFALAMAFASNDLVNFIGVPLAALDSLLDMVTSGDGDIQGHMMGVLDGSARSPMGYLLLAGVIMIVAIFTSKKAQGVVRTSVDLARQDEGDEMFGSSRVARSIVRASQMIGEASRQYIPYPAAEWIESRFNRQEMTLRRGAAFDELRASVNLVLAALLIIMGTNMRLPLSTTYVTFMVAMGSSLADRAWGRESAVFRITGVLSVIGGWFITAGLAFMSCAIICLVMKGGGYAAMTGAMALAMYMLYRSNRKATGDTNGDGKEQINRKLITCKDREKTWSMLAEHFTQSQAQAISQVTSVYNDILDSIDERNLRALRNLKKTLKDAKEETLRNRKLELIALRHSPMQLAIERNTWFHLAQNSDQQYIYSLRRMLDPVLEHIDNGFTPMPKAFLLEFEPVRGEVRYLMESACTMMTTGDYTEYHEIMNQADDLKDSLSGMRKRHIDRMQREDRINLATSMLYLNIIQETQELLSIMRHQIRSTKRFTRPVMDKLSDTGICIPTC